MLLHGQYYDGHQPIGSPATLSILAEDAVLMVAPTSQYCSVTALRVSPRVGRADRFILLPVGGQFQCRDDARLDSLPQEVPSEGPVAWLEQRVAVAVTCVAVIAALLMAGYFYGLPLAAERVAARIPIETEEALGQQALAWLDDQEWLRPTKLEPSHQQRLREGFATLIHDLPLESHYRLEFRDSIVGANAFAFPGGTIVATDAMVSLTQSDDEVHAILAHEIGHVEHRHTMRKVLQASVTGVVAGAITADAASLTLAVSALPVVLLQLRYSRELEAEADEFAFQRLHGIGISPEAFATIMDRLAAEKNSKGPRGYEFLSTHPVTADRVARARAAAAE